MRHAFLMTVHSHPEMFGRILKWISASNHYIFVNVDKKYDIKPFINAAENIPNVIFTDGKKRVAVNWGGFSQIQAELNLLSMAAEISADYFHLISGQDFPCVNADTFDMFFELHEGESYMHFDNEEEAEDWKKYKYPERYKRFHFNDLYIVNQRVSTFIRIVFSIIFKRYERPDISGIAAGWNWFSWHKSVVDYIFDFLDRNSKYIDRFHYTSCCDEIFFHTILNEHTTELNINRDNALRFIEWHPKRNAKSLPLILDEREYQDIVDSRAFFCRKVDPSASGRLIEMLEKRMSNT